MDVGKSCEAVYRLDYCVAAAASQAGELPTVLARVGAGRYALLEELGRGALARPYRAYDEKDRTYVAVKLLDTLGGLWTPGRGDRFLHEVALAQRLRHPFLVQNWDVLQEPGGGLGLVMDLVDGQQLGRLIRMGALPAGQAVQIAQDILPLLDYLDGAGVYRLDLIPTNIVIRPSLEPVVVDLGLARQITPHENPLTTVGVPLGTPMYAPPEQLRRMSVIRDPSR